jgi:hypothetical protein
MANEWWNPQTWYDDLLGDLYVAEDNAWHWLTPSADPGGTVPSQGSALLDEVKPYVPDMIGIVVIIGAVFIGYELLKSVLIKRYSR